MIFGLRVTDMSLDTLRMCRDRGRKGIAWTLGFLRSGDTFLHHARAFEFEQSPDYPGLRRDCHGNVVGI